MPTKQALPLEVLANLRFPYPLWIRAGLIVVVLALELWFCLLLLGIKPLLDDPRVSTFRVVTGSAVTQPHLQGRDQAQKVQLPERCNVQTLRFGCTLTFTTTYDITSAQAPLALYIPRYRGHLQGYVNGIQLLDSRWVQSPLYIGQSTPLVVSLPEALLHQGNNTIEIQVHAYRAVGAMLGVFQIGPKALLEPRAATVRTAVITIPLLINAMLLAVGLLTVILSALRLLDQVYLLFGVICLCLPLTTLPVMFISPSLEWLWQLTNPLRLLAGSLLLPFAYLFNGRRPPVPSPLFIMPVLVVLVANLLAPDSMVTLGLLRGLVLLGGVLALAGLGYLIVSAWRNSSDASVIVLGTVGLAAVFSMKDGLVLLNVINNDSLVLLHHISALPALVLAAILLWRFSGALKAQEQFAQQLQRTVVDTEARLRETLQREREQSRSMVLQQERTRLMRDLHDGLSGQLVSIQSLCEFPEEDTTARIAAASRAALVDLRLVIASMDDVGDDLGLMLGSFRERIEPQIRAARLDMQWQIRALPDLPGLDPTASLHLLRILQESVVNAIRHAQASVIRIEGSQSPHADYGIRLCVADDGHGGAAPRPGGRGFAHMRERAAAVGALLRISSDSGGTVVMVDLPKQLGRNPPQRPPAPR